MSGGFIALGQEGTHAEADSFDALFNTYRDYVFGLTYALLGDRQDAEDVTQEVFLQVYRSLPTYRPERGSLRTWIGAVAVNASRRYRRNSPRNFLLRLLKRATGDDEAQDGLATGHFDPIDLSLWALPEDRVLQGEVRQAVHDVLTSLRPEHRTVLVLHYYLDLPCDEIARLLDCPEGTVHSRLHYARRLVRRRLEIHALRSSGEVGR